jgi:hypothetical protein
LEGRSIVNREIAGKSFLQRSTCGAGAMHILALQLDADQDRVGANMGGDANPYQAVSGVGEDAYLVNVFGQNVLYVKAKGYRIVISGVDPFNDLPTLKSFASAILGRI